MAQTLFPNGTDASPSSPRDYAKAVEYTRQFIDEGAKIIYEAVFIYNEVLIYADIIVKQKDKWKVYEVKSSTSISETYLNDISVQYHVMSNSGLDISDILIIYINNEYIRKGNLDINQLFNIESLFDIALEKQDRVAEEVAKHDYVLTPGRYVGLEEVEDDFDFNERFTKLKAEFEGQLIEETELNKKILENLSKIILDTK